jgi:hypothetical protein
MMESVMLRVSPAQMRKLRKGSTVQLKPDMVGSGVKIMITPDKAKRLRASFGKSKEIRVKLNPQEIAASNLVGGRVNLRSIGRTVKDGVNTGLRLYREKVRPHIKDELKSGVKQAIKKGVPAAVTAAAALTGQPQLLAAVPAASYAADKLADPAANALGKVTGAYGMKKKGGKAAIPGMPGGIFRTDMGTLMSLGHPALNPQLPVSDFSKPNIKLMKDPGVVKYKKGGSFKVN